MRNLTAVGSLLLVAIVAGFGLADAASPVFGPGSGSPVPGVQFSERISGNLTPKERSVVWDKTYGPMAGKDGSWQRMLGGSPSLHATSHKVGAVDSVGAAGTSTAGLVRLGTTTGTACEGNDSRLTGARTPTAHETSHRLGAADALPASSTSTAGLTQLATDAESSSSKAVSANDSRLSNSRTPTAHSSSHAPTGSDPMPMGIHLVATVDYAIQLEDQIIEFVNASGSNVTATLPGSGAYGAGRTITFVDVTGAADGSHTLTISPGAGTINGVNGPIAINSAFGFFKLEADGANGWIVVASSKLGTTAARGLVQFAEDGQTTAGMGCLASDARLSNSRTPTGHASSHNPSGSDALQDGSTSQKGFLQLATSGEADASKAVNATDERLTNNRTPTAHASSHAIGAPDAIPAASTTTAGLSAFASDGTTAAGKGVESTDSRLSNTRIPTSHGSTHTSTGTDPIPAASITYSGLMSSADKVLTNRFTSFSTAAEDVTLTVTQTWMLITNTDAPRFATLPLAAGVPNGGFVWVKDGAGGAGSNNITIQTQSADALDAGTTFPITVNYGSKAFVSNGVNHWWSW